MNATRLQAALVNAKIVGTRLTDCCVICNDWFEAESSITSFVLRAIFLELLSKGWDDEQGIPTAEYSTFEKDVLPAINDVLNQYIAAGDHGSLTALAHLLTCLNSAHLTVPIIVPAPPQTP